MIKQGDRVYPFYDMGKKGKVISIRAEKVSANMVGGTLSALIIADVLLDDGTIVPLKAQDLMREE